MTKRKIVGIGVFLLVGTVVGSLLIGRGQSSQPLQKSHEPTTVLIRIDGPPCCSYCDNSLDVALRKHRGVMRTSTDYELGLTQVRYDKEKITLETIRETIKQRGYKVISVIDE